MTLDEQSIKEIILNNPNKGLVQRGQEMNRKLRMHLYGENMDKYLEIIEGYEGKGLNSLRQRYAKSNKALFTRISRPIDKVFSAKGGSTYFNMSATSDAKAMQLVANVRDGYSSKRWVEHFWKAHYLDDPCGLIFMEIGNGKDYRPGTAYPTYKSIFTIYDYLPKGTKLEYVVFTLNKAQKRAEGLKEDDNVYRVVDDAFDYLVKRDGDSVEILRNHTFINYFFRVPAIVNSDIVDPQYDNVFLSMFDPAIEDAESYLLTGSIRIVHNLLHGYPKYWEYADDCAMCGGGGQYEAGDCPSCKGSGKNAMTKPSQAKLLNYPESKETPIVTPNVAGYVEPSETYHKISTEDLTALENTMYYTVWGVAGKVKTAGQSLGKDGEARTATEIVDDIQPLAARLAQISDSASRRIKFINDHVVMIGMNMPSYGGSSVNLGKRFALETADVIWERYIKAKKDKAPMVVLNDLLVEYIDAQYADDPVGAEISKKLMYVEPFVHNTIQEVQGMHVADTDYLKKLYFSEWLAEQEDAYLFVADSKELEASLSQYIEGKEIKEPETTSQPIGFSR